eukprot:scaffold153852_cov21-Tisochrysis_lutea.AAC.1
MRQVSSPSIPAFGRGGAARMGNGIVWAAVIATSAPMTAVPLDQQCPLLYSHPLDGLKLGVPPSYSHRLDELKLGGAGQGGRNFWVWKLSVTTGFRLCNAADDGPVVQGRDAAICSPDLCLRTYALAPTHHLKSAASMQVHMRMHMRQKLLPDASTKWSGACMHEIPSSGGEVATTTACHFGQCLNFYQGDRLIRAVHTLHPPSALVLLPRGEWGQGGLEDVVACAEGHQ